MKKNIILPLLLAVTGILHAQVEQGATGYYQDAIRFSSNYINGSSRIISMGGAQTAIGGDISAAANNPAGLGFFINSEFVGALGVNGVNVESDFLNTTSRDARLNLNIPLLGVVLSDAKDDLTKSEWRGGSFAISLSRTASYQSNIFYEGVQNDPSQSYVDRILATMNGNIEFYDPAVINDLIDQNALEFKEDLAYAAYIVKYFPDENEYISDVQFTEFVNTINIENRGSRNELNFAYGGNYNDKFYFGASANFPIGNFSQIIEYTEDYPLSNTIDYFRFTDEINSSFIGARAGLGIIYRVNDYFRMGASYKTPTVMRIDVEDNYEVEAVWLQLVDGSGNAFNAGRQNFTTIPGEFNYRVTEPGRASIGGALFFKKRGFITFDAEYLNYQNIRLKDDQSSFRDDERTINNIMESTWNYRIGGEIREDKFRIRAGYALYPDPYNVNDEIDRSNTFYTFGLGYREKDWYLDFGTTVRQYSTGFSYFTYADGTHPSGSHSVNELNFSVTAGFTL